MRKLGAAVLAAYLAGCSGVNKQSYDHDLRDRVVKVSKLAAYQWSDIVISEISREEGEDQLMEHAKNPTAYMAGWYFVQRGTKTFFVRETTEKRSVNAFGYRIWSRRENLALKVIMRGDNVWYYALSPDSLNKEEEWQFMTTIPTPELFSVQRDVEKDVATRGAYFRGAMSAGAYGIVSFGIEGYVKLEDIGRIIDETSRDTVLNRKRSGEPLSERIDEFSRKLGENGVTLKPVRRNRHVVKR